jgi:hypothetical protein
LHSIVQILSCCRGKEFYKENSPEHVLESSPNARSAVSTVTSNVKGTRDTVAAPLLKASSSLVKAGTSVCDKAVEELPRFFTLFHRNFMKFLFTKTNRFRSSLHLEQHESYWVVPKKWKTSHSKLSPL